MIKSIIRKLSGPMFYGRKSFAQEGEDLVVDRFMTQRNGFYIDIGCHHPFRFSNTYFFYKKGWRGICIDPLPGTVKLFNKWRPRDITFEVGISGTPSVLNYYMFNEPALNTCSEPLAKKRITDSKYKLMHVKQVNTQSLASILENQNMPKTIDLLSIDCEGLDLEILKSNNWQKFKPKMIIVECLSSEITNIKNEPTFCYLQDLHYYFYAKTGNSFIFALEPQ